MLAWASRQQRSFEGTIDGDHRPWAINRPRPLPGAGHRPGRSGAAGRSHRSTKSTGNRGGCRNTAHQRRGVASVNVSGRKNYLEEFVIDAPSRSGDGALADIGVLLVVTAAQTGGSDALLPDSVHHVRATVKILGLVDKRSSNITGARTRCAGIPIRPSSSMDSQHISTRNLRVSIGPRCAPTSPSSRRDSIRLHRQAGEDEHVLGAAAAKGCKKLIAVPAIRKREIVTM